MVTIEFYKNHFKKTHIFFAKRPKISHTIGFFDYFQCESLQNILGFKRKDFYTKLIDLTQSEDEIFSHFNNTTKYQIKRAIREGAKFAIETDINAFIDFYNDFARVNDRALMEYNYIKSFKNNFFVSKAIHENECLVMHANILDLDLKRVCMFSSVSHFRNESDFSKRKLIARLNRFLHFKDMIYAKNKKMTIYDIGGYALNSKVKRLKGINKFKDNFGGELIRESNYTSYMLWFLRKLKRLVHYTSH